MGTRLLATAWRGASVLRRQRSCGLLPSLSAQARYTSRAAYRGELPRRGLRVAGTEATRSEEARPRKERETIPPIAPRGAAEGFKLAAAKVLGGFAQGLGALVAGPIGGAMQGGVTGFAKGLTLGLIGAVLLPLQGIIQGSGYVFFGLYNHRSATRARKEGKEWDPAVKKWVLYNLKEEAERVLAEDASASTRETAAEGVSSGQHLGVTVKDTRFYDVIGVATGATTAQIKSAYYKAAKRVHPDLNPGDEAAQKKFQELSKAYQVLSNRDLRAAYDRQGMQAVEQVQVVDPGVWFALLFGSEKFEKYMGTLRISSVLSAAADGKKGTISIDPVGLFFSEEANRAMDRRAVKCAYQLARMLDDRSGDMGALGEWASAEAGELVKGAFAPTMLYEIGWAYENAAQQFLGFHKSSLGLNGFIAQSQRTAASAKTVVVALGGAIGVLQELNRLTASMPKKPKTEEEFLQARLKAQKVARERIPILLTSLLKVCRYDISQTMAAVCHKILTDKGVSEDARKKRAEALLVVGRAFRAKGQEKMGHEVEAIRHHIANFMHGARSS